MFNSAASRLLAQGPLRHNLKTLIYGLWALVGLALPIWLWCPTAAAAAASPGLGVLSSIPDPDRLFNAGALAATGNDLYVIAEDVLTHYRRDPLTGSPLLTDTYRGDEAAGTEGLFGGLALAVAPDGKFVYAATSRGLLVYARDPASGALGFRQFLPQGEVAAIAVSTDNRFVYAALAAADGVAVLARDGDDDTLSLVETQSDGVGGVASLGRPRALALSPGGDFLYVAGQWSDAISVFRRAAATGRLTFSRAYVEGVGGAQGLIEPGAIALSADGAQVYVTSAWANTVTAWQRNPTTGDLSAPRRTINGTAGITGLLRPSSVVMGVDGAEVLVKAVDSLVVFARARGTGVLTLKRAYRDGVTGIGGLVGVGSLLPVGALVYATSTQGNALTTLTPLPAVGGGVSGTVGAPDRAPVKGVAVSALVPGASAAEWVPTRTVWTDAGGRYALTSMPAGNYRICFYPVLDGHFLPECFDNVPDPDQAAVLKVAGAVRVGINAVLAERRLSGRVTDTAGAPLAAATVTLGIWQPDEQRIGYWGSSRSLATGADGAFDLSGLTDASYRVCASAPDHATTCLDDVSRDQALNIQLAAAGHLSGTLSAVDGGPLPGIVAWAFTRTDPTADWQPTSWETTDANGRYDLRLGAGTYRVCFYSSEYFPRCYQDAANLAAAADLGVTVGETKDGIDARLSPAGRITGQVKSPLGAGVAEVSVLVYLPTLNASSTYSWTLAAQGHTDNSGNYTIGQVAPGEYWVCFHPSGGSQGALPLYANQCYQGKRLALGPDPVIVNGALTTEHIDVTLTPPGSISGRITNSANAGIGNVWVTVGRWRDLGNGFGYLNAESIAYTNAAGQYRVDRLGAGSYQVCFRISDYLGECWNDKPYNIAAEEVSVVAGRVTPNINAVLSRAAADTYESDDTKATAKTIAIGQTQARTLYRAGGSDQDWVTFRLAQRSAVRVAAKGSAFTSLALYNRQVAWPQALGLSYLGAYNQTVIERSNCAAALSAGDYDLSINGAAGAGGPGYSLTLTAVPCLATVDTDRDGKANTIDNCVFDANPTQVNTDGDGSGDACDPDDDNDGALDAYDSAPTDPTSGGAIITLPTGRLDSARYGWGWGGNAHRALVAATFVGDGGDRLLHIQGYDVDSADEVSVWLNGKRLGYLTPAATDALGTRALWWLAAADQVKGTNRIEIRQKSPGETWGLTEFGLYTPGVALGNLKSFAGGDVGHGDGFELHLPKSATGYLLALRAYDSDTEHEVVITLNGKAVVDLPKGLDEAWGPDYQLLLPGSWLAEGDNRLVFRNRGLATEDWGLRLAALRLFGAESGYLGTTQTTQRFTDRVRLLLAPNAAASVLDYQGYDLDIATEVQWSLNGAAPSNCPKTPNKAWGGVQHIDIPAGQPQVLVFDNTLNPPASETWAVRLSAWTAASLSAQDTDGDGVLDSADNCPYSPNGDQANLDGDALGDACDDDLDGDGHPNLPDAFPRDPAKWLATDGADLGATTAPAAEVGDPAGLAIGTVPPARIGVYRPDTGDFTLDTDGDLGQGSGDRTGGPLGSTSTDLVIVGDWNGDGRDELGFYRPGTRVFYLDFDGDGRWGAGERHSAAIGAAGDLPVIGDWDADGSDEIGTYSPGTGRFTLDLDGSLGPTGNDVATGVLGAAGDRPLAGDWNGDGSDELGVWRAAQGRFLLDRDGSRSWNAGDLDSRLGQAGDLPVVGDWNGDGIDEIGVYRPSEGRFYLHLDGTDSQTPVDLTSAPFGAASDQPLSGRW